MDFKELVQDFSVRHGIEGLAAEGGEASLDIDGIVVGLTDGGDVLDMAAEIGVPPVEGQAVFEEMLLEANFDSDLVFAKSSVNGCYILLRRIPLAGLGAEEFDAELEKFVSQAETWRKRLADFRPAAPAASAPADITPPSLGASDFLRV